MARARNIKPGFFKNEDLAECTAWARLCFAGLWTLADREGRLEDRPKRIKGELFAFDSIEVEPLLVELQKAGFIERYAVEGRGLIQVLAFLKHQNPHHREPESELPPPQSPGLGDGGTTQKPQALHASDGNKAQGKPKAKPGQKADESSKHDPKAGLIPDSGFRSPDTGEPVRGIQRATPLALAPAPLDPETLEAQGHTPTPGGLACRAIKAAGIPDVNPGHPNLLRLLAGGVTPQQFADTATELVGKGKGKFALLLATVEGRLHDAAAAGALPQPAAEDPWATRAGVDAIAKRLGLKPWDECCHWPEFVATVRKAAERQGVAA